MTPVSTQDPPRTATTPRPKEHHTPPIGDPEPFTPKESKAIAHMEKDFYEDEGVIEISLDMMALDLDKNIGPVRDWQPGDTATLETRSGRYLVDVVQLHSPPDTVVDAATVRVVKVIEANGVAGLRVGDDGRWPLATLQLAPDAA